MENGRCVCDDDRRTFCVSRRFGEDNGCFLLQRDPRYCGGCDNDCVARGYDSCCDGECGDSGRTRCVCGTDGSTCDDDSICVVDAEGTFLCQSCSAFGRGFRRCGSECGNPEEDLCCEGKLYRGQDLGPGDWRCCGPEGHRGPVNVDASAANCGECGRRCSRDKPVCYRGRCRKRCPRRLRRCGDTCGNPRKQLCCKGKLISKEDAQSDPNNCGECGRKCEGPFDTGECCNGNCCDINGDTCCPDGCKNLALDDENCGGCGNVCQSGEYCRFGTCTQPPS